MNEQMAVQNLEQRTLRSPFTLTNGSVVRNRLVKSAMSEALGDPRNDPTERLVTLYRTWARGGQAVNITGNIMVDRTALGEHGNVVLDERSDLDRFRHWASAGTANDTHLWAQLCHPGKQIPSFLAKEPVAPSAVPLQGDLEDSFNPPRALEDDEIRAIVERFTVAARLAERCGFTGVQIHAAHGYLISQFLSPHHNQRTDQWGGRLENRMRFLREIHRAIRRAVRPEFVVAVKLNSTDFSKGGFSEEDSLEVVKTLAQDGIDLVEISGGSYEKLAFIEGAEISARTARREAFFIDFAEKIRAAENVPLMLTGGFRSAGGMLDAVHGNAADLIGLARGITLEPAFAARVLDDGDASISFDRRSTGSKKLDRATMMDVIWHQYQILRVSRGQAPQPDASAWKVLVRAFLALGRYAFQRVRA